MTKIWLKLQLHFSQKTTTKTKLKSAVKINTVIQPCAKHDGKGNPLPSYTSKIERKIFLLTQLNKNV